MDVRAAMLVFQDFDSPDRSFGPGYPREWPPDVRGMSVPKTSSLGWSVVLDINSRKYQSCMYLLSAGKEILTKLFVAQNGPFGTPFWTPKIPRKSLCGSLFCVLSKEMRHINFFLGAQDGAFWVGGGGKMFMLKKFMCFFCPKSFLPTMVSGGPLFSRPLCFTAEHWMAFWRTALSAEGFCLLLLHEAFHFRVGKNGSIWQLFVLCLLALRDTVPKCYFLLSFGTLLERKKLPNGLLPPPAS